MYDGSSHQVFSWFPGGRPPVPVLVQLWRPLPQHPAPAGLGWLRLRPPPGGARAALSRSLPKLRVWDRVGGGPGQRGPPPGLHPRVERGRLGVGSRKPQFTGVPGLECCPRQPGGGGGRRAGLQVVSVGPKVWDPEQHVRRTWASADPPGPEQPGPAAPPPLGGAAVLTAHNALLFVGMKG